MMPFMFPLSAILRETCDEMKGKYGSPFVPGEPSFLAIQTVFVMRSDILALSFTRFSSLMPHHPSSLPSPCLIMTPWLKTWG
ncbi:hypothetical protein Bpfe_006455 [Biomphalaria pfeifferi]|uniref:Uncharacterized protein n=1 Tax=Biomphalaria pfeifferi TaxID=112525 RepID=A0AAD8C109_BIOPF|nr:hypothetical protein Bpfe_006455 [Biomphalaria pfeifferi]